MHVTVVRPTKTFIHENFITRKLPDLVVYSLLSSTLMSAILHLPVPLLWVPHRLMLVLAPLPILVWPALHLSMVKPILPVCPSLLPLAI